MSDSLFRWVDHDPTCNAGGYQVMDCTCGLSEHICQCGHAHLATHYHAPDCPVREVWRTRV